MLGGTEVENAGEEAFYRSLPELGDQDPSVGSFIELEPCVPEHYLAAIEEQEGRPCPRVELDPRNDEPLSLFQVLLREDLRPLAPALFGSMCGGLSREAQRGVLDRAIRAVTDPDVTELLYPKPEKD